MTAPSSTLEVNGWEAAGLALGLALVVLWCHGQRKPLELSFTSARPPWRATPTQAVVLVAYFFAVTFWRGSSPDSVASAVVYVLLGFFAVCVLAGGDAGNMSTEFSWQFR